MHNEHSALKDKIAALLTARIAEREAGEALRKANREAEAAQRAVVDALDEVEPVLPDELLVNLPDGEKVILQRSGDAIHLKRLMKI